MKSTYTQLAETVERLTKSQRKQFNEASKGLASVEQQINCAEAVLAGKVITEAKPPCIKRNGAADNGRGELLTESTNNTITETAFTKGDAILYKAMGLSESQQRRLMGLPSDGTKLSPAALREFRFLLGINLSESDALRGALKVS